MRTHLLGSEAFSASDDTWGYPMVPHNRVTKGRALSVESVITTETKSRRSVRCEADVRFREEPVAGFDAASWELAKRTSWHIEYAATRTDDDKALSINLYRSQCRGPACAQLASTIKVLEELDRREADAERIRAFKAHVHVADISTGWFDAGRVDGNEQACAQRDVSPKTGVR